MNKEEAIRFAGLMEDYLNIPSFVCEMIQQQLEENKYKEVVEYVVQRRNEIESKPDFISDRNAITMLINQNEEKDKEIERLNKEKDDLDDYNRHLYNENKTLNNIIDELEKYIKENSIYYNTSDGCQWVDQFKVLDKLKDLKENNE